MPRPRTKTTPSLPALAPLVALLAGCLGSEPKLEPLSQQEIELLATLRRRDPDAGRIEDKGTLFMSLDQNMRKWRELAARNELGDADQRTSLEYVITGEVYFNFDVILAEFERGSDPEHRTIAAAALGFSRIPAPDEPGGEPDFPVVHPRAVEPLLSCLDSGNDELVMNALLGGQLVG